MPAILVIDAMQDNGNSIATLLNSLIPDCTVETASTGVEGISKAEDISPDAIFLDTHLPEMDGFKVLKVLKNNAQTRHVPVIMLSALRNDVESCVRALEIDADAFLTKPLDKAELVSQVNTVLRKKRTEDKLYNKKKMEAIGVLASGIGHDFNNILFPIMGYVEMMQEDLPTDSPYQDYLKNILQGAVRARDLIRQIMVCCQKVHGRKRITFPIRDIIKEHLKLTHSSLPATIEIHKEMNTPGPVTADPTHVHQIVTNLISNAYQAMQKKGGRLGVTLKTVELNKVEIKNPDMASGSYVLLAVSDTGVGMKKAILERIFDPYFTTKSIGRGTGLGLSVVHGIVKSYGGGIQVSSKPGIGSIFQVYLPQAEPGPKPAKNFKTGKAPGGYKHVPPTDDDGAIFHKEKHVLKRRVIETPPIKARSMILI